MELRKLKDDNFRMEREVIRLGHEIEQKNKNMQYLEKEIEEKKNVIKQRDFEFKEYVSNMNKSLHESLSNSSLQPDMTGTVSILERTLDEKKRDVDRLQSLLDVSNKKFEDANLQMSSLNL